MRLFAVALVAVLLVGVPRPAGADEPVELVYFGAEGCPFCAQMEQLLDDLEVEHADELVVRRYDVSRDPVARQRWIDELAVRGQDASGVPTVVLGQRVWVGFDRGVAAGIRVAVSDAVATGVLPEVADPSTSIDMPFIGAIDAASGSAIAATMLIAFVDGFNPCSLWVLMVLLAMVVNAGASRGRIALIGATFLTVTGLIYGVFIAGVFTVLGFVEHLGAIRVGVAALALVIGAVNIKDYLTHGRGFSFSIPQRAKPRIYRGGRALRDTDRSLLATFGLTIAMAAGIALVELPCTAGLPVIWSGIMHTQGVAGAEFAALLALYLAIYVADELLVFFVVLVTLRIERLQQHQGRLLKLVGGMVMGTLGVILLTAPGLMERIGPASLTILGAVVAALLIDVVRRARAS